MSRAPCRHGTFRRTRIRSAVISTLPERGKRGPSLNRSSFKDAILSERKPTQPRASAMRNALKVLPAFLALAGLSGCHKQEQQADQNAPIDINNVSPNDIETLPADESSETPSNELANGFDTDNDVNAAGNGY